MSVYVPTTAARDPRMAPVRLRTAIATVCLSGTLEDKLDAASAAGFDGVEIFEPDFVASPWSAGRVRAQCADLGLSVDLYQPFRDFDSARPEIFEANLRRADRKFDVMQEMGTDLILVCSSVAEDCATDDDQIAEQLHQLASAAAARGMRISYEALAWGRHVSTYEHSWDIVRKAGHPALGLCLDSFHILSRGSDPAGIERIPADKLFFLQLADAPHLEMDVLQWSRHYRLFPGQGTFDLPAFLNHVITAGYAGPLSLEVFNDVFRQAEPHRAAVDARRSLLALQEAAFGGFPVDTRESPVIGGGVPAVPDLGGFAFAELVVDEADRSEVGRTLDYLGFVAVGHHRTKPVELWQQGDARILINGSGTGAAVGALGIETADPSAAAERAQALLAPLLPRTRGPAEADLAAVGAPDGTSLFFCRTGVGDAKSWLSDFPGNGPSEIPSTSITHIDHVALTQPYDRFDEAALFYRSVLGLRTQRSSEVAAPFGLVRNRAVVDPTGLVRICLSVSVLRRGNEWHPGVTDPQHVAFATDDVIATARAARAAGLQILDIPANYYDDLDARLAIPSDLLKAARELCLLYDTGPDGEFLHFYTRVLGGRVFFEVIQRTGHYQGYGETNGPIRMAAHRRDASGQRE
jgi:4-hydroxyphenylpyruvate dioxygenase